MTKMTTCDLHNETIIRLQRELNEALVQERDRHEAADAIKALVQERDRLLRDLEIMVRRADNEERAMERAERAEAKLAALQTPQDVAGLVDAYDAARYRFEEWDGDVLIPEQNADLEWRVTEKNAARQRIIDALLSLSAQLAEKEAALKQLDESFEQRTQELIKAEAECAGLKEFAKKLWMDLEGDTQHFDATIAEREKPNG